MVPRLRHLGFCLLSVEIAPLEVGGSGDAPSTARATPPGEPGSFTTPRTPRPQRVAPALRGAYLASSVSRQAPPPAPAAALACSHLSRARSAGARSARLYQRLHALASAAANVARPASPIRLASPISKAAARASRVGHLATTDRSDALERPWRTPVTRLSCQVTGGAYEASATPPHAHRLRRVTGQAIAGHDRCRTDGGRSGDPGSRFCRRHRRRDGGATAKLEGGGGRGHPAPHAATDSASLRGVRPAAVGR